MDERMRVYSDPRSRVQVKERCPASTSQKRRVVQEGVAHSRFQHFTLGILGRLKHSILETAFHGEL